MAGLASGGALPASAATTGPIQLPQSAQVNKGSIAGVAGDSLEGTVIRYPGGSHYYATASHDRQNFKVTATLSGSANSESCTATGAGQGITKSVSRKLPAVNFGPLPYGTTSSSVYGTNTGAGYRISQTSGTGPVYDFVLPNGERLRTYTRYASDTVNNERQQLVAQVTTMRSAANIMSRLQWSGQSATAAVAVLGIGLAVKEHSVSGITSILYAACGIAVAGGWFNSQGEAAAAASQEYNTLADRYWEAAGGENFGSWTRY